MEARRDVFQAIADPTRRQIIHLLSKQSMSLNSIADNFESSRPAISKHIKILVECGLINVQQEGRERFCYVQLKKLREVKNWAEQYSQLWDKKLGNLQEFLGKEKRGTK